MDSILLALLCLTATDDRHRLHRPGRSSIPSLPWASPVFKAALVILFFMHVKYSSRLMKLTVAAGFFTFLVLITMTLSDYISRAWGLW